MLREAGLSIEEHLDAGEARRVLRRAVPMLGPYRRLLVVSSILMVAWTGSTLAGPLLVRYGIDDGINTGDSGALTRAVVAYVIVAIGSYFVYRTMIMTLSRAAEGFLRDLRVRVFDHLLRLSMSFYDSHKAGVLVSRMTSDVDALSDLVQTGLLQLVMNALLLGFSVVVLAIVSWKLLLVCLFAVPFVVAASIKFQRDSNEAYLQVRDRIGSTLSRLQEGIAGVRVVQAFGRQEAQAEQFLGESRMLYQAHMDSVFVQAWYLPVVELAGLGTTALVVGIGGWMVIAGTTSIGTIAFFILTLGNLFDPIQQLSQLFNTVQSAGAGLRKLYELLDTPIGVPERKGAIDLPEAGELAVEDVSFAYGDGPTVLRGAYLAIEPGERLALVGPTGAGKSTLAKLVARLYDPTHGRVRFGGVDLRDATTSSLRQRMAVVPQEGFLFNGTIRDNVRVARQGATDDEVEEALRRVGVLDRFMSLPEGLDTEVRERGSRLSAGEKQLVSLARAALADPAVLVLDEATSSLDPGTEALVEGALTRLVVGRTVVVIAHRLSTAARADRIGVVVGGELVEVGAHDELMRSGGTYAQLYRTWIGAPSGDTDPEADRAAGGTATPRRSSSEEA